MAPTRNLRPPCICNDFGHNPQTDGLRLQQLELGLGFDLQRNLGLPLALPSLQYLRFGIMLQEVFVAGQGRVRALRGDFAYSSLVARLAVLRGRRVHAFGHAQISAHHQHELAFFVGILYYWLHILLLLRSRLLRFRCGFWLG